MGAKSRRQRSIAGQTASSMRQRASGRSARRMESAQVPRPARRKQLVGAPCGHLSAACRDRRLTCCSVWKWSDVDFKAAPIFRLVRQPASIRRYLTVRLAERRVQQWRHLHAGERTPPEVELSRRCVFEKHDVASVGRNARRRLRFALVVNRSAGLLSSAACHQRLKAPPSRCEAKISRCPSDVHTGAASFDGSAVTRASVARSTSHTQMSWS